MIASIALVLALVYLGVNFVAILVRNYKAHRFFQTKSPNLPVVPNPNIFHGHALSIVAQDKNWKIIENLHEHYGPTFGYYMMDQPWVSTKDLDLIKLIEIDEGHKHVNRAVLGMPFTEFNNSIWQVEDDSWRQARRLIAPALTNHKVRSDETSLDIESVVAQLAASMESRVKKARETSNGHSSSFVVDARNFFERYTLAVILLITYKQPNLIDFDSEQDGWINHLNSVAREVANPIVHTSIAAPFLRPLCELVNQLTNTGSLQRKIVNFIVKATDINRVAREQFEKLQKRLSKLTANGGEQRKVASFADVQSQGAFKRRLVDTIIDSYLDKKIHYDHFVGNLLFLMLAAFSTTADTISCLMWLLAKNPDVQETLRRIILTEGIDADYVLWCINETIRFHPALPLGTGRVLADDVTVNGQFLAKGTYIMPTTRGVHHDPSIWPEPEKFKPDRWRNQASFHPAAFLGFGLGPRNCAGIKLAVYEIKLVLRMVMSGYRIEVCDETPDEWRFSSPGMVYTLSEKPIKVRFTPLLDRGDATLEHATAAAC